MVLFLDSFAQKKKRKGIFQKRKKIESVLYDSLTIDLDSSLFILDQGYLDSVMIAKSRMPMEGADSLDTAPQVILSYDQLVQVTDHLAIDSVWLARLDYFSIWSSTKVNPYELDGELFKDTIRLPLIFDNPKLTWSAPIPNMEVTSPFGLRRWRWHYGDDFRLKIGDSVQVSFDGIVRIAHYDRYGYGNYVLVRHYNGLETLYGHLKKRLAKVGDVVKSGDVIGLGGNSGRSTAPHLHYEIRYEGNALQPNKIINFSTGALLSDSLKIEASAFTYLTEARKIRYHRVRSGDTLSHISYRYGVPIIAICRMNRINRSSILRIGQRLRIT